MSLKRTTSEDLGFVLAVHEYREHDAFVLFLGEKQGLVRLVLPAFYKQNSKQMALGQEFSLVRYQSAFIPERLNRIYSGQLIKSYKEVRSDWDWLLNVSLYAELITKFHTDLHHQYFYQGFASFLESERQVYDLIQIIWDILEFEGIQPYCEHCVYCESSKINAFSIKDGGFLCTTHTSQRGNVNELLQLRALSLGKLNEVANDSWEDLLKLLMKYLIFHTDYHFNAWKLRTRV